MAETPKAASNKDHARTDGSKMSRPSGSRRRSKPIVVTTSPEVKPQVSSALSERRRGRPGRPRTRRQSHGSAWHWKQTDSWYYTLAGTKKRIPLFDEQGERIRGKENKEKARLAFARVKLADKGEIAQAPLASGDWIVARVCSEYIQHCERGVANDTMTAAYKANVAYFLNDLCKFCGALPILQLKKTHMRTWVEQHKGWKSPATEKSALATVTAAFNHAQDNFEIPNPVKGLKKPTAKPRLHSIPREDEEILLKAVSPSFRDFLFAGLHTGLRPFCELARMTADHVEETPRGMMWCVYSSKTDKTRKIPVRPEVASLTRKMMATAPKGSGIPLFRTAKGKAWKRVNGVLNFCAVRKKLGWGNDPVRKQYSCYSCRHTFAHRMLSGYWNNGAGCTIETLAELMGDTPKVAFDHYGREWGQHYQDPLWAAMGIAATPARRSGKRQTATA